MISASSPWNSLEIAKLAVGFLTPVLLFALGIVVTRAARRIENAQWASRKLIERRIELHKDMAPKLNDLYCFFATVGHFRDITPPDALKVKRELDKLFFQNEQLFSPEFGSRYNRFIDSCFKHSRFAEDAKLIAQAEWIREQRSYSGWDSSWNIMFIPMTTDESKRTVPVQEENYRALMSTFADDLGVVANTSSR
jgi:hypothetical protein